MKSLLLSPYSQPTLLSPCQAVSVDVFLVCLQTGSVHTQADAGFAFRHAVVKLSQVLTESETF